MTRTQIQFPDPLYRRLKKIAEMNDLSLADVVRRATELYARRFPEYGGREDEWSFPTLDIQEDFLTDPAEVDVEADVVAHRSGS